VDQAYQKQDYAAMQRSLHTLKGNAGTLGIPRVAEQAAKAEKKLKQKKYAELSEDLLLLRASFLAFQQTFHATYNPQSYV
ncbi:MAG: Hpt domain-containing protein, partial [Tunicatimonas sp.]